MCIHGIVYLHWIPEVQTINQNYYLKFPSSRKKYEKNQPESGKKQTWVLHQDIALEWTAVPIKTYSIKTPSIVSLCCTIPFIRLSWHHLTFFCSLWPSLHLKKKKKKSEFRPLKSENFNHERAHRRFTALFQPIENSNGD